MGNTVLEGPAPAGRGPPEPTMLSEFHLGRGQVRFESPMSARFPLGRGA